jgi:hypothetical protein
VKNGKQASFEADLSYEQALTKSGQRIAIASVILPSKLVK